MRTRWPRPFWSESSDVVLAPFRPGEHSANPDSPPAGKPGDAIVRGTDHADYLYPHSSDRVFLYGGDDYAYFQRGFKSEAFVDGGSGYDHVVVYGDNDIVFTRESFVYVEQIDLFDGAFDISGRIGWNDTRTYIVSFSVQAQTTLHVEAVAGSDVWVAGGFLDDALKVRSRASHLELLGNDDDDNLIGGVFGQSGDDTLADDIFGSFQDPEGAFFWGGNGADKIRILSGSLSNTIYYLDTNESPGRGTADRICGWIPGSSRIELGFDSDLTRPGHQTDFHLGETPGRVGDIVVGYEQARDRTVLEVFVDPDDKADLVVFLKGHIDLTAADFVFSTPTSAHPLLAQPPLAVDPFIHLA